MPGLWNARKDGEAIGDADLAHRVTSAVSEVRMQRHLQPHEDKLGVRAYPMQAALHL